MLNSPRLPSLERDAKDAAERVLRERLEEAKRLLCVDDGCRSAREVNAGRDVRGVDWNIGVDSTDRSGTCVWCCGGALGLIPGGGDGESGRDMSWYYTRNYEERSRCVYSAISGEVSITGFRPWAQWDVVYLSDCQDVFRYHVTFQYHWPLDLIELIYQVSRPVVI